MHGTGMFDRLTRFFLFLSNSTTYQSSSFSPWLHFQASQTSEEKQNKITNGEKWHKLNNKWRIVTRQMEKSNEKLRAEQKAKKKTKDLEIEEQPAFFSLKNEFDQINILTRHAFSLFFRCAKYHGCNYW